MQNTNNGLTSNDNLSSRYLCLTSVRRKVYAEPALKILGIITGNNAHPTRRDARSERPGNHENIQRLPCETSTAMCLRHYPDAQTERPYGLGGNMADGEMPFLSAFMGLKLKSPAPVLYRTHVCLWICSYCELFRLSQWPCLLVTVNLSAKKTICTSVSTASAA